jgi:hypothetical protein
MNRQRLAFSVHDGDLKDGSSRCSNDSPSTSSPASTWLKVIVDPDSREVFAFQPQIVPGNRTAVPGP